MLFAINKIAFEPISIGQFQNTKRVVVLVVFKLAGVSFIFRNFFST